MSSISDEHKPEFQVFLNLSSLKHPLPYWEENLSKIRAEIENQHGILATYTIAPFVSSELIILVPTKVPFLKEPEDKNKYDEVQSKIAAVVARYDA